MEQAHKDAVYYQLTIESMVNEMNALRSKHGLSPLTISDTLTEMAMYRASEIVDSNLLSHTRPDGSDCFSMQDVYDYHVAWYGECIGEYYRDGIEQVHGWYESTAGHREILLHSNLTKVGCGVSVDAEGNLISVATFSN